MSLEYAILGFLQYKPISGYDLKKRFDETIKNFWSADQSQIYKTLNKLTADEYIEMELIIQNGKPNSKVYHITEKGKEHFIQWLRTPIPMQEPRIPWLVRMFFAANLTNEEIIVIFEQLADQIRRYMEELQRIDRASIAENFEGITSRDTFFMGITHEYGVMIHNSVLQWTESTIEKLKFLK